MSVRVSTPDPLFDLSLDIKVCKEELVAFVALMGCSGSGLADREYEELYNYVQEQGLQDLLYAICDKMGDPYDINH
jgi:hypothetical protein